MRWDLLPFSSVTRGATSAPLARTTHRFRWHVPLRCTASPAAVVWGGTTAPVSSTFAESPASLKFATGRRFDVMVTPGEPGESRARSRTGVLLGRFNPSLPASLDGGAVSRSHPGADWQAVRGPLGDPGDTSLRPCPVLVPTTSPCLGAWGELCRPRRRVLLGYWSF